MGKPKKLDRSDVLRKISPTKTSITMKTPWPLDFLQITLEGQSVFFKA